MTSAPQPVGRRERNKADKLGRIIAAAQELFAEHGVDDVTTQQIADKADIGSGTLFLYAKSKAELFLLVQNSRYAESLEQGRAAAEATPVILDAVMVIIRSIVECNREQVENGRTYLKEMVFGDPREPHHGQALALTRETEEAITAIMGRDPSRSNADAVALASVISAVMFLSMAATANVPNSVDGVVEAIRTQVAVLLRR